VPGNPDDDEADLGAAVVEMGPGTTTIATYSGGRLVHTSGFALGGHHITMDLARGVSACIADAERIQDVICTVLTGGSDAHELMSVQSTATTSWMFRRSCHAPRSQTLSGTVPRRFLRW